MWYRAAEQPQPSAEAHSAKTQALFEAGRRLGRTMNPTAVLTAVGLIAGLLTAQPATAEDEKPEWVLSIGGTLTRAIPSFSNDWDVRPFDDYYESRIWFTSRYAPATSTGLQGTAQMWLPSGLGVFVELQQESQQVPSEIDLGLHLKSPGYLQYYDSYEYSMTGQTDTERFKRNDTRVHLGAGYRMKVASRVVIEATGGVTRFTLKQALAREIQTINDQCTETLTSSTCAGDVFVETGSAEDGNSWGFNVGAGATVFFSRNLGLGTGVRYSYGGVVELEGTEAVDENGNEYRSKVKIRPGGLTAYLALRIRF